MSFSLKINFVLANSADLDEMPHNAAFHLGLRYLQMYPLRPFQSTSGKLHCKTHVDNIFFCLFHRLHIPEIRMMHPPELRFKKDTKVTLTFSNPAAYNVKLQLLQVEGNEGETVTAKVSVNKGCGLQERYQSDIYLQ